MQNLPQGIINLLKKFSYMEEDSSMMINSGCQVAKFEDKTYISIIGDLKKNKLYYGKWELYKNNITMHSFNITY